MIDVLEKEIWKEINWSCGLYKVSNFGRVISLDRYVKTKGKDGVWGKRKVKGRMLKLYLNTVGYYTIDLCIPNIPKRPVLVHRLIAGAFIENVKNKPCINHIDGIKANNHYTNLEWCTHKENMQHARRIGLIPPSKIGPGEKCPASKLKEYQVIEIKVRLKSGEKIISIYKDYPVTESAISEIKAGRSWASVCV